MDKQSLFHLLVLMCIVQAMLLSSDACLGLMVGIESVIANKQSTIYNTLRTKVTSPFVYTIYALCAQSPSIATITYV
jgi:hypothetical protein